MFEVEDLPADVKVVQVSISCLIHFRQLKALQMTDTDCDFIVVLPGVSYRVVTDAPLATIESRYALRENMLVCPSFIIIINSLNAGGTCEALQSWSEEQQLFAV